MVALVDLDFVCILLNKSEPSCLLEMVLSIITGGRINFDIFLYFLS